MEREIGSRLYEDKLVVTSDNIALLGHPLFMRSSLQFRENLKSGILVLSISKIFTLCIFILNNNSKITFQGFDLSLVNRFH